MMEDKNYYPEGDALVSQIAARHRWGAVWRTLFLSATIIAIVVLMALLYNIFNSAFGLVAIENKIEPTTLSVDGVPLAQLPPETLVEELLADIWYDVLGLEQISIHDNFFELGGHSLLVTRVLSRLQEAVDVALPLRDFFAAPTIAQLAETVEGLLTDLLTPEDMLE